MLDTMKSPSYFVPPQTHYFTPEDLATMRHAYHVACQERPMAVRTEAQRLTLAKAIVVVYNPILPETALLGAAFDLIA